MKYSRISPIIKVNFCEIKNTEKLNCKYYKTRRIGLHYHRLKLLETHLKNTTSEFTLIINSLKTVPETIFHNAKMPKYYKTPH